MLAALASVIAKNPSYGKFRLFWCYVGIGIGINLCKLLLDICVKKSVGISPQTEDDQENFVNVVGRNRPSTEWIASAAAFTTFCVGLHLLAK